MEERKIPRHKHFQKQHVVVRFPGHEGKIEVLRSELKNIALYPGIEKVFRSHRLVINLKLRWVVRPEEKTLNLDPPVVLRVRYDATDCKNVPESIQMAYWDEKNKQWILFTDAHKFDHKWNPKTQRGWAIASLKEWGDPPIAVGT